MPDQVYIGNFAHGLKNRVKSFNNDNDSFSALMNAYAWRGQVKRKRGTSSLARFQRQIALVASVTLPWQKSLSLTAGAVNLITALNLESEGSITLGTINFTINSAVYTEPTPPDGTLLKNGGADPGSTINYATGEITIAGGGSNAIVGFFSYFPDLPVLGLEDFISNLASEQFPLLIGFDTTYSYEINQSGTPFFYNVNYYKNSNVPFKWSGQDYQQFFSTNYQHAFWASNNKPGLNLVNGAYVSGSGTTNITFTFTYPSFSGIVGAFTSLVIGDVLWFNEWSTGGSTLDGQSGIVTDITGAATGTYVVTFQTSRIAAGTGIAQLLTNTVTGQDGIKWYDGDPTGNTGIPNTTPQTSFPLDHLGWANFAPPLTAGIVSIDDETESKYYLVGALHIVDFKDRLLFSSPWIQTSTGSPIQLQDVMLWSWNGTPYYNDLVPSFPNNREIFDVRAYYVDQVGFGGYLPAGISKPLTTLSPNEDVLLIGFGGTGKKTRFIYTGNDLQPFLFYLINSEMPSSSTFSAITMDKGMIDVGQFGICMTTQQSADRIDMDIPNEVFQIQALNNGQDRVNAVRDFYNEWIYFSYPTGSGQATRGSYVYPSNTFFLNYRDNTWAIFYENFTHHGTYRKQTFYTWKTLPFKTWAAWKQPWNAGSTTELFSNVIAGNPQGFVVIKSDTPQEAPTGSIAALASDGLGNTSITSYNHCVHVGDYLYFLNAIGSTFLNGQVGKVIKTPSADVFVVDIQFFAGNYLGLGTYTRFSKPLIQTKQFPFYWDQGMKTRLGVQKYLLESTDQGQITLNMYLSTDPNTVWNTDPIYPFPGVQNNSLVYSQLLLTCPEDSLIPGITRANNNLQMPTAQSQDQIWHRVSTSLIGDTVQIGITLSDAQMRNINHAQDEIILHGINFTISPAGVLC